MNRNLIYVCKSVHNTTLVTTYSGNCDVNSFLHFFDVWGSRGHCKVCKDNFHYKLEFECCASLYDWMKDDAFIEGFNRMGVTVTFNYHDVEAID